MNRKPIRAAFAVALLAFAGAGFAQSPSENSAGRGGTDGVRPADGAIKGGSLLPGEKSGVPTDSPTNRCQDLSGTLREQCLAQERGASTGGTRPPEVDVAKPPPQREGPPPQNPPRAPR
jgi:hypothetical protein